MSKWLVVMAAVVALGAAACGSDGDDGDGKGRGGLNGDGSGCEQLSEEEMDACTDAFIECGMTDGGLCKAEVDAYMECEELDCFEERGAAYVACIEDKCPDAAPCMECQ